MRPLLWCSIASTLALWGCPEDPLEAARAYAAAGDHVAAGEAFFRAAKSDPASLAAWDGAIESYCSHTERVGECMTVLDTELDLLGSLDRHRDALGEVLERRARARMEAGIVEGALEDLDRAERAAPERASVLVARAKALVMLGRAAEAEAALHRAKRLQPDNAEADALFRAIPKAPTATVTAPEDTFGGAEK